MAVPPKPKFPTITPITKEDLKSWDIKFIAIDVPTFAISLNKNCNMNCYYFKTKDEAKKFIEQKKLTSPIILYDVEKVYKEKAIRSSKIAKEDCFYLRLADIDNKDFARVYDNIKIVSDTIYKFNWDFSNFNKEN